MAMTGPTPTLLLLSLFVSLVAGLTCTTGYYANVDLNVCLLCSTGCNSCCD